MMLCVHIILLCDEFLWKFSALVKDKRGLVDLLDISLCEHLLAVCVRCLLSRTHIMLLHLVHLIVKLHGSFVAIALVHLFNWLSIFCELNLFLCSSVWNWMAWRAVIVEVTHKLLAEVHHVQAAMGMWLWGWISIGHIHRVTVLTIRSLIVVIIKLRCGLLRDDKLFALLTWLDHNWSLARIKCPWHTSVCFWGSMALLAVVVLISTLGTLLRSLTSLFASSGVFESTTLTNLFVSTGWVIETIEGICGTLCWKVPPVICIHLVACDRHRRWNALRVSTRHLELQTLVIAWDNILLDVVVHQLHLHAEHLALQTLLGRHFLNWWATLSRSKMVYSSILYRLVLSIPFECWALCPLLRCLVGILSWR